ncbi:MAG: nicotinate-nucleotide adenylyltransferase [Leptolyngbya foveolarum]|jgi:nicotinate-nucleotide adenylyltransferase|uniref:Probable nicotinate-nucleotide adenylyltransferase n=1 Tax=Leptolyngbya foveolarum TaxID=47253 RepID=A0A2W4VH70_9CYAN|nr:MAG: nicotinate-nucleotide adenylyltransferase [Leptolyngbya foveolarum]
MFNPWRHPPRIALFGTSADPPHRGHQGILTWLANEFDEVAVWAADNPYKPDQSPLGDRAQMLRLMISTLAQKEKVSVHQELSDRYSIHSIARARKIWPNAQLSLVVGADLIAQLPKWYKSKEIFSQVEILVFPRPGYAIAGPALSDLQQLAKVAIAHPPNQHDIASSRYRQSRCNEVPADLPPVIRDYVAARNLYPCTTSAKTAPI